MIKTYVVDAFITDRPFSGNPAGICFLDSWKSESLMQHIAAEMNHSETAFIVKQDDGFSIRYFTPTVEVPLCGHATLATASVIWHESLVHRSKDIIFYAKGGSLKAYQSESNVISIDFPKAVSRPLSQIDDSLLSQLHITTNSVYQSEKDLVYELDSENEVKNFNVDVAKLKTLPYRLHILTAESENPDFDFVSRVFAPTAGIDEDPATGIAHCILGPIWAEKLNKTTLKAYQASQRGALFGISVSGEKVQLTGTTKIMLKGHFYA